MASGTPTPTLSESNTDVLPGSVSFNPTTGILSGVPGVNADGTYTLHFTASNGVSPDYAQTFTLFVSPFYVNGSTLTIFGTTSADTFTFAPGTGNTFSVAMDSYSATYSFGTIQTIQFIGEGGPTRAPSTCRPIARPTFRPMRCTPQAPALSPLR